MKLLEWLLNIVFSVTSLWDKSSDQLLNEHRAYERTILLSTVMAMILMVVTDLLLPATAASPADGIKFATYNFGKNFGLITLILAVSCVIVCIWNVIGLFYFRHQNGIES